MTSHIIGEAIFDITFGPEKQHTDMESTLERLVQARLLPVIEEVFDEMALDREAVRIDRLELDLGPVRDDELENELAARLREKLRDALRDYVLSREKTVVAGRSPVLRHPADLEKLAYFLRYGHLTWNTSVGQPDSVVDLLEEALLQSPAQVSSLFEGSADFDTVVFRLASQFPESAVQDLVDRLAMADPAFAAKVAAALKIHKGEAAGVPRVRSDEQGIARAYELYDRLRRQLTEGDARKAADLGPLIEELRRKYPWQLLRFYRELQAGEGRSTRIPDFYGFEELRLLIDAFLSVEEEITDSIKDFRQSIEVFADKSADKKAYYTQVLHRLMRNEVLDLEEFSTHSGPAAGKREGDWDGDGEDIPSLVAGRPERAREWFRHIAADPLALHALIERLPERWLLRLLHLFQESSADRVLQAADGVIESAYIAGMKLSYAKVALLKWEFILSAVVGEERSFEKVRFIAEFGQLISGDVPQSTRELFLSRLQEAPSAAAAQTPVSWDALIRAYDLYDLVSQRLDANVESREIRTTLQELFQKYPLHIRRLYRELQADAGRLIRIQQTLSPADLAILLEVFLAELFPGREQASILWDAIARRAALSEDPGRFHGQVLQRLLRRPDIDVEALVAEPSTEESDEQVFEGLMLLLEGGLGAIRGDDLVRRFEAILRDRPQRAQRWLLEALSSEPTSEAARKVSTGLTLPAASPLVVGQLSPTEGGAVHLLRERALLDVFRLFGGESMAVLIRAADAVADTLLTHSVPISEGELLRLKWAFLFRYTIKKGTDFEPEAFSAEFAAHLTEHLLSVSERVRRIQLKLWDRSQSLDEPFLVQTLRGLDVPASERLLLAAESVAHTFYRAGFALPQSEIARLKWQMIFRDTLLEDADRHIDEFAGDFEALLRDRLDKVELSDLAPVGLPVPQDLDWSGSGRAYELYELLRRTLVDGKPDSASGLMAALEETVRRHPWQLLRLYREMRAGDGISDRLKDLYGVDELRRLAEALLTVSGEPAEAYRALLEAIAAFEPREVKGGDLRDYYADILGELVQAGRPPAFASALREASLPEKIRWIQARLKDPGKPVPERFLVHVLSEMDSPAVRRLLQTSDSIADAYYRAGLALPHGEVARLKWEMLFSDALLEETETHAAEFAEHLQSLIGGRLNAETDAETIPLASAPLASPVPVFAEFKWIFAARSYELYERLRRTLVDGELVSASGLMASLDETLRLYPWQLLRLYREMQTGDGLSVRSKDFYGAEELRRIVEALLAVSPDYSTGAADTIVAFDSDAADLRLYYAEVLEQLAQPRRPLESVAAFIPASLAEKVRWIQARLRDRSQPLAERLLVQVLGEIESPAIAGLLRTADSVADSYYRGGVVLPAREIARLKWGLIFSDALLEEPEQHAAEFAEHFRLLLNERVASVGPAQPAAQSGAVVPLILSPGATWSGWIRSYELYDRLRRTLVAGKPGGVAALTTAVEETLRLYPWQLLRLYREMQAGDGLSDRVKTLYRANELQRIVEAFLIVSEEQAGAFEGLKKSILAFAQQSKDQDFYYAALLEQLVRGEFIDLELALALSREETPEGQLPQPSEPGRLARSSDERAELQLGALAFIAASLPEKVRWIQARLRDRSQAPPERLLVQVLREIDSPAIAGLLRTADSVADSYYRSGVVLPAREIARLKWELIFSDVLLEEPERHAAEFAEHFRLLLNERVVPVGPAQSAAQSGSLAVPMLPAPGSNWSAWIRAYELYDRLRRTLVEGKPDSVAALMAVLEETLRLHPWQLLRLYREMQAGDGLSDRVKSLYGARELQRITEAFLTVSEEQAAAYEGLKKSILAFAQQSKDQDSYYAALLEQLVQGEVIDLELALARSSNERAESQFEVHGEWQDLVRSYDLYENLRREILDTAAVGAMVKELVEELARSYPWQIRKLYRELESTALQAGILRSRDAGALRSLIQAFARTLSLDPYLAAMMEQELATASPDDAVQRYSRVLERVISSRVKERELTALAPPSPPPSTQRDDARELVRVAEEVLLSGVERLQGWIEERLSSVADAERLVRLLPEGLIARILIAGAPSSNPALLLVTAERLAMAASMQLVAGLSPRRARELKWIFVLRHAMVEKHAFVESQLLSGFAAFIHSQTPSLPSVEALTTALAGAMKVDGMSLLIRHEEDKTSGAIELERGISVQNAGMVLAAPYLPKLFAELNLTEGRKFRSDEARERAVHLLQFMVNESEETAEHELVLNKILVGMDTAIPVQRRIELLDREKIMIESLIRGMILNWKKLGQTSVAGFRESFLQREGTLRLTDDAWRLEVFPRAFDMLLDYIPWTFETIKHPWMERLVHVQWR